tara:strand:+ start:1000 stop:1419 length:420 start_codon:yes stop_codon:yes gene_type:complete
MATTATITLNTDIIPYFSSYSKTMTLTEAGTSIDLKETTGYSRKKLVSASKVDLFTMANTAVDTTATTTGAKVFIKNIGYQGEITKDKGVKVLINSVELGVLYGGDWMMIPVTAADGEDIEVQPDTDDAVVLEYAMFFQ